MINEGQNWPEPFQSQEQWEAFVESVWEEILLRCLSLLESIPSKELTTMIPLLKVNQLKNQFMCVVDSSLITINADVRGRGSNIKVKLSKRDWLDCCLLGVYVRLLLSFWGKKGFKNKIHALIWKPFDLKAICHKLLSTTVKEYSFWYSSQRGSSWWRIMLLRKGYTRIYYLPWVTGRDPFLNLINGTWAFTACEARRTIRK